MDFRAIKRQVREVRMREEYMGSAMKNDISNKSNIYQAKELKELKESQKGLTKLRSKLNKPITKNDLEAKCVTKKAVDELIWRFLRRNTDDNIIAFYEHFLDLPPVTLPQDNS